MSGAVGDTPRRRPGAAPHVDPALIARVREVERSLVARWPESVIDPSLERVTRLLDLLGNPQAASPSIHITGTNGKTSVARMIDQLLQAFGLRTGRFTSPHLQSVRERICLDGEPLSEEQLLGVHADVAPFLPLADEGSDVALSFFEVITAMGFAAFADAPVDVAVLEVGMGGRWDATNVADSRIAVITPVELDHMAYLGGTVELIAAEKAGVIKPGATAVLAEQHAEAERVLLEAATAVGATVVRENRDFSVAGRHVAVGGQLLTIDGLGGRYDDIVLPLHGGHQASNAACALAAVEAFLGAEGGRLDVDVVREGFLSVTSPGRLEVVRRSPTVLLDAAHNPAGARALAAAVEDAFGFTRLVGVVAMFNDKDAYGVLEALQPVLDHVVVTRTASPRAMHLDELAEVAEEVFGEDRVSAVEGLDRAIEAAVELAETGGGQLGGTAVLITGSVVTVGEARALLTGRSR